MVLYGSMEEVVGFFYRYILFLGLGRKEYLEVFLVLLFCLLDFNLCIVRGIYIIGYYRKMIFLVKIILI